MKIGLGLGLGATGAPWTPGRLRGDGLGLWLRADLGLTLNGSAVTTWADQSGNGNDFTDGGSAARRPAYSATSFNSRPGITFDGSSDYLTHATNYTFGAATTIILVATPATSATAYILSGSGANFGFISNFASVWLELFNGADRKNFAVPTSVTKYTATVTQTDASALTWRRNGAQVNTAAPAVTLSGKTLNTIGAATGGTNHCNAVIAELIICTRVLTASEIANAESYIQTRYAHY